MARIQQGVWREWFHRQGWYKEWSMESLEMKMQRNRALRVNS